MKSVLKAAGGLMAVAAIAGALLVGSHALRQGGVSTADVIVGSPAPTVSPDVIESPPPTPDPSPSCIPNGVAPCPPPPCTTNCLPDLSPQPTDGPPNTRAPLGTIQPSWWLSVAGPRVGVLVTVLYDSNYVSGAQFSIQCTGPGNISLSGTTAPRASWAPTSDPSIPPGPSAFFWTVANAGASGAGPYHCHGTASYNGLSATF